MISCEFFPPGDAAGVERLCKTIRDLQAIDIDYYSITYGAGGSTRERSLAVVEEVAAKVKQVPVMPHLTCIGYKRDYVLSLLKRYHELGIRRVLALRGDLPAGGCDLSLQSAENTDCSDAAELVAFIRENIGSDWQIAVAAYPEMHPQAASFIEDVRFLKKKADLGADFAITQYFYNLDAYLYLRDELNAMACDLPIYPGIMPITNYMQLTRFSDGCGAEIPRWIRKRLEMYQDDRPSLLAFGLDVVSDLCRRLLEHQAPGLHFYTLNRSASVLEIIRRLNPEP